MRDDVKAALHVNNRGVGPSSWPGPAAGWSYTSSYDACNQGEVTVDKSMVDPNPNPTLPLPLPLTYLLAYLTR